MAKKNSIFVVEDHTLTNKGIRQLISEQNVLCGVCVFKIGMSYKT